MPIDGCPGPPWQPRPGGRGAREHPGGLRPGPPAGRGRCRAGRASDEGRSPGRPSRPGHPRGGTRSCELAAGRAPRVRPAARRGPRGLCRADGQHRDQGPARRARLRPRPSAWPPRWPTWWWPTGRVAISGGLVVLARDPRRRPPGLPGHRHRAAGGPLVRSGRVRPRRPRAAACTALHPHVALVDEALVARAHEAGLSVAAWTVNDSRAPGLASWAWTRSSPTTCPWRCPPSAIDRAARRWCPGPRPSARAAGSADRARTLRGGPTPPGADLGSRPDWSKGHFSSTMTAHERRCLREADPRSGRSTGAGSGDEEPCPSREN